MILPEPVLIVGGYGYGNVGDEAILAGLLRRLSGRRITVVTRSPEETARAHGVRAIGIHEAVPALRSHRSVLIGGGGLFGRDMGRIGRLLPAFGLVASALGRTLVVDGVGIDDNLPTPVRIPVRAVLSRSASIVVRDAASARVLDRWGIESVVEPDRSHEMPAANSEAGLRLLRDAGVDVAHPVIGLCLTSVNPALEPSVSDAVDELIRGRQDVEFCFIPMSRHPSVASHDDRLLATRLRMRHPELRVLDTDVHPSAVLSAFGHLAAAVCMRFHSLLFAERMRVPLVAVPYAPKVTTWLEERGVPIVPVNGAAWSAVLASALAAEPSVAERIAS